MDPGPRKPGQVDEQTGFGTPRSADDGAPEPGAFAGDAPDVTDAELTGMKATAHPAQPDELDINRSGSGGSGGPATQSGDPADTAGSTPASMHELLTHEEDDSSTAGG